MLYYKVDRVLITNLENPKQYRTDIVRYTH
jgi:hypothetical protein